MKLRQRELFIQSFEPFGASFRPRDKTIPSLVSSGPGEAASGKGSLPIMAVDSALGAPISAMLDDADSKRPQSPASARNSGCSAKRRARNNARAERTGSGRLAHAHAPPLARPQRADDPCGRGEQDFGGAINGLKTRSFPPVKGLRAPPPKPASIKGLRTPLSEPRVNKGLQGSLPANALSTRAAGQAVMRADDVTKRRADRIVRAAQ